MHRIAKAFVTVCALVLVLSACGSALAYQTSVTQTVTGSYSFYRLGSLKLVASEAGVPAALYPDAAVSNDIRAGFTTTEKEPVYIFVKVIPGGGVSPRLWSVSAENPRDYTAVRDDEGKTPLITFSMDESWQPVGENTDVFFAETDKTVEIPLLKDQKIKATSMLAETDDVSQPAYSLAFRAYAIGKAGFGSPEAAWEALKSQTEVSGQ